MDRPSAFQRFRAALRRLFFWLPQAGDEEIHPEHGHDHALVAAVVGADRPSAIRQIRFAVRVLPAGEQKLFLLATLIAILGVGTAAGVFVYRHTEWLPAQGGNITIGVVGEPQVLNPIDAVANDVDLDMVQLIYSGLFRYDGLTATPDLVSSYEWSPDGLTLTLHLRTDAVFHDGQPVSSADVVFTYDAIQDPDRNSPLAPLFHGVSVAAPDDQTVVFTLAKPDATFLDKLTVGILPAHLWQDVPAENARLTDLDVKPVGSGPYEIKSFTRDAQGAIHSYTLTRAETYYGVAPFVNTVTFDFFPDESQALDALRSDQIDDVAFVPDADVTGASSLTKTNDIRLQLPEETIAFFNLHDGLLKDKAVRGALIQSVDRADLVSALSGAAVPVTGPFPFLTVSSTAENLDAARAALDADGWKLAEGGNVRELTSKTASSTELDLTISYPQDPDIETIANALAREWSLVGAKVTLDPEPIDTLMKAASRDRTTQITLLNVLLPPEQDLTPFWWSGQTAAGGFNVSGIAVGDIDQDLQNAESATSSDALDALRTKLSEDILTADAAAFLIRPSVHELVSNRVNGVVTSTVIATPAARLNDLLTWYVSRGLRWK